jgi:bla regulator protein blaR1
MKHIACCAFTLSLTFAIVVAQEPSARVEYVASVKRNTTGGGLIRIMPGNISVTGMPAGMLVRLAYGLQDFQMSGGPSWLFSDRFDIEAKVEGPLSQGGPTFVQALFRQLLADRFNLRTHKETRELPIFALVLARPDGRLGANLTRSSDECVAMMTARGRGRGGPDGRGGPPPDGRGGPPLDGRGGPATLNFDGPAPCGGRMGGIGRLRAGGSTIEQFAAGLLSERAQRVVIDKTGLTGYYDIALNFTPTPNQLPQGPPPLGAPPPQIDPDGPSLFTALQEQLGLKLQDSRGPVEIVVIDSIDQPTEN